MQCKIIAKSSPEQCKNNSHFLNNWRLVIPTTRRTPPCSPAPTAKPLHDTAAKERSHCHDFCWRRFMRTGEDGGRGGGRGGGGEGYACSCESIFVLPRPRRANPPPVELADTDCSSASTITSVLSWVPSTSRSSSFSRSSVSSLLLSCASIDLQINI